MSRLRAAFAIPGDLSLPTGGYGYDRRVLALLPQHGIEPRVLALPGSFPFPDAADLEDTKRALDSVAPDEVLLIDGLAWGACPKALAQRVRAPIVALCHHPLALETGLTPAQADALRASEIAALAHAAQVVVSSAATRATLVREYGVDADRILVAEPGVDPAPPARGSGGPGVALLAVGSIVPRKGYDVLTQALAGLADLDWTLTVVGALDRAPATVEAVRAQIAAVGLSGRMTLAGAVSDATLAALYDRADLFVLASRYEGYGMVLTEALARGLPLVATAGGAAADTAPDAAALKVPPDDALALRAALERAISDPALRAGLAAGARAAAPRLPSWDATAATVALALRRAAHAATGKANP